jgi:DNA replication and repair protein RecF
MKVLNLKIENFRNIEKCDFSPCEGINIIYGDNAQGKTNLIEALWLFCGQKSFRGAKDSQLVRIGSDKASLYLDFFSGERRQTAEITIDGKRKASLNEIALSSPAALSEKFCAVVFAPTHLDLIKEGPRGRRSFLDNTISQMRPKYAKVLSVYNRAVLQRNTILRDALYHRELEYMLDVFEKQIANAGAYIIAQRKMFLEAIEKISKEIYFGISKQKEEFSLNYLCSAQGGEEETLIKKLKESRAADCEKQNTSVGPHRDDIEFFVNGLPLKSFGSQGQQRSAVLSIKLAQAEVLKRFCGEQPIAILDDVMSELDRSRQDFLLNYIEGWQVFITCCDADTVRHLKDGKIFKMQRGELKRECISI